MDTKRTVLLSPLRFVAALLTPLLLAACDTTPTGDTGGRIDPYRTTASDRASTRPNIPSLLEFSEITAQRLAQDLAQIDEIRHANQKVVLELGTLANQTSTPTSDFELIQARVRGQLLKSDVVRRHFIVVMDRARMNAEMSQVSAGATAGNSALYDPAITYVLQGDFHEQVRGDRRQYYFTFSLTNLASRVIVFHEDYDLAQVR